MHSFTYAFSLILHTYRKIKMIFSNLLESIIFKRISLEYFPFILAEDAPTEPKQPYSLEATDANAIEEVNLAYENVKEVECLDITKEGSEAWDAAVKRYEERIGKFYEHFKRNSLPLNLII